MVSVCRSTIIDAPISSVWQLLRDFNGHDRWHPAVHRSELQSGRLNDQLGAIRSFYISGNKHLREQLLSLSDKDHQLQYCIIDNDLGLENYVAHISLKPVTDGNKTFWSWSSTFSTPTGQAHKFIDLIGDGVYEAGFAAVRAHLEPLAIRPLYKERPASQPRDLAVYSGRAIEGKAIVIDHYGTKDELHCVPNAATSPGPLEVRLRQSAIGVNFIDIYCRTGYFDLLTPPGVLGIEAAGVVIDVGNQVSHLKPGQRVAYACLPLGAYSSVRTMNAALVIPLPDHIEHSTAAAGLLKGMSANFLLHQVHPVKPGEIVLVYAPAGGVGRLLCQWASHLGAKVIGVTSTEEKSRIARAAGAQHVIQLPDYSSLAAQVLDVSDGHGADVIYDAVGRDSYDQSVAALANCGHLISFGQASGDIGKQDISSLALKSATLSRPNYSHYTDTHEKISALSDRVFTAIKKRVITIEIGQRFALEDAADAHHALENRLTTSASILLP